MAENETQRPRRRGTKTMEGIPHLPGTDTFEVEVAGETIHVPVDHDGSAIKVELPSGRIVTVDGWDPAERALAAPRPMVACGNCGQPQVLTDTSFSCSACGARNEVELRASTETGASVEES